MRRLLVITLAAVAAGCGGDGLVQAKGRVTQGGQPLKVEPDDDVSVFLVPVTADGKPGATLYPGRFDAADGTFAVTGNTGRGLPPGKYRVVVVHERKKKDLLKGAFDAARSPVTVDVDGKQPEIVVDVDRK